MTSFTLHVSSPPYATAVPAQFAGMPRMRRHLAEASSNHSCHLPLDQCYHHFDLPCQLHTPFHHSTSNSAGRHHFGLTCQLRTPLRRSTSDSVVLLASSCPQFYQSQKQRTSSRCRQISLVMWGYTIERLCSICFFPHLGVVMCWQFTQWLWAVTGAHMGGCHRAVCFFW